MFYYIDLSVFPYKIIEFYRHIPQRYSILGLSQAFLKDATTIEVLWLTTLHGRINMIMLYVMSQSYKTFST